MVRAARNGDLSIAASCELALMMLDHPSLAFPTPAEMAGIILRVAERHDIRMLRAALVKEE